MRVCVRSAEEEFKKHNGHMRGLFFGALCLRQREATFSPLHRNKSIHNTQAYTTHKLTMDVQRSIRENVLAQQDAFKDLQDWEEEINKKDERLKKLPKPNKADLPPVRSGAIPVVPKAASQQTASAAPTSTAQNQTEDQKKKRAAELKDKVSDTCLGLRGFARACVL